MTSIAEKYAAQWLPNGEVSLADLIQAAVDEAQFVPVVGEPTDAAYKWMIANGVEPLTSLHKLGERLAAFLDEDQFSGCETLLLTAITAINTFVPVPAAELATLREQVETHATELRAYEATVANLNERIRQLEAEREGMALVQRELLDKFPELNTNNYGPDDVDELNAWGIELVLAAAPQPKKEGE